MNDNLASHEVEYMLTDILVLADTYGRFWKAVNDSASVLWINDLFSSTGQVRRNAPA